jgi:hypothetical protein
LEGSTGDVFVGSEFAADDGPGGGWGEAFGLAPEVLPGRWAAIGDGGEPHRRRGVIAVIAGGGLGGAALFPSPGGGAGSASGEFRVDLGTALAAVVSDFGWSTWGRPRRRRGVGSGSGIGAGGGAEPLKAAEGGSRRSSRARLRSCSIGMTLISLRTASSAAGMGCLR